MDNPSMRVSARIATNTSRITGPFMHILRIAATQMQIGNWMSFW